MKNFIWLFFLLPGCSAALIDYSSAEVVKHLVDERTTAIFPTPDGLISFCIKKEDETKEDIGCMFFRSLTHKRPETNHL